MKAEHKLTDEENAWVGVESIAGREKSEEKGIELGNNGEYLSKEFSAVRA